MRRMDIIKEPKSWFTKERIGDVIVVRNLPIKSYDDIFLDKYNVAL